MDAIPQRYYRRLSDRAVKGAIAPSATATPLTALLCGASGIIILSGGTWIFGSPAATGISQKKPYIDLWGFFFRLSQICINDLKPCVA